jgi:hypothetical protein
MLVEVRSVKGGRWGFKRPKIAKIETSYEYNRHVLYFWNLIIEIVDDEDDEYEEYLSAPFVA